MVFRFNVIIFGYVVSPYILLEVMRQHCDSFSDDKCTSILKSCFYVDNLTFTSNDIEELKEFV